MENGYTPEKKGMWDISKIRKLQKQNFDLLSTVKRLQEENEQLKLWKESEMSVWRPLLDYFHNEDKCIRLGLSISKEALHRSKEYVRLQEEKKELVEALKRISNQHSESLSQDIAIEVLKQLEQHGK